MYLDTLRSIRYWKNQNAQISVLVITKVLKCFCLGAGQVTLITCLCYTKRVQHLWWGAKYRGVKCGGEKVRA